jgi:hypothetical protein
VKFLNYEEMIPRKYLIPSNLLKEYTEFIAENMP